MKIKRSLSVILMFCFLFFGYGCQKTSSYDLSYRERSFCARVEGNQFGLDFCCDIYCEEGSISKIVYLSPLSLKDVIVFPLQDGTFKIQKGDLSFSFSENSTPPFGLFLPGRRLLLEGINQSSVNSVQKISNGFILNISLPGEEQPISLSLGEDGLPVTLSGTNFSYRVRLN